MLAIELLILVALIAYLGYPIYRPESALYTGILEGDEYHKLLYRKDTSLLTIKDLEFEFETGKIDEEDYLQLKNRYEADAIKLMKEIDSYKKASESEGAKVTAMKSESAVKKFCSACGNKLETSAKFCSSCGTKVS
ncbi:MAG: zinc ribbon domain-containing protein [Nitrospinota bacterium]|nr:zinc ribbon domain-containing protein [Nitrospinota bacterium]